MAASVVIIKERSGRQRRVELIGGALPLQGASWGGMQLLATAWNPGNPEATQHVLGPQEVPSAWDFMWNTTRIVRTPVVVFDTSRRVEFKIERAITLALLLEEIFRGGSLLDVSWISSASRDPQKSPRMSRVGRVENWDFKIDRPDDIAANVTFTWIGRGEDQPKVSQTRGENMNSNLQAAINATNAVVAAIQSSAINDALKRSAATLPTTFSLGQLEAIANAPKLLVNDFARTCNGLTNRLKHIGDIIQTVKETPGAILGRLVDVANNGVAVANQFVDKLTQEGPETQSARNKVNVLTKNASYFSNIQDNAGVMAETMEKLAEAARRRHSGVVPSAGTSRRQDKTRNDDNFKVHMVRTGDTMMSIAQQYYGSPDLGDELAVANGLPGYTITPPRMPIIIPTRRNLEESNRNRV